MGLLAGYIIILGWVLALMVIMGVAVAILVWVLDHLTGEIRVWHEIKKKNMSVALVVSATIISVAIIIGLML